MKNAIGQVFQYTGKIDVLINNAGVGISGRMEELPNENFIREMDVKQYVLKILFPQGFSIHAGTGVNSSNRKFI